MLEQGWPYINVRVALRHPVRILQFSLNTRKNPAGLIRRYKAAGTIRFSTKQKSISAASSDYDWKKAVHKVLEKLKNQIAPQRKKRRVT